MSILEIKNLHTEVDGKATGWRATYHDGKWVEELPPAKVVRKKVAKKVAKKIGKRNTAKKKVTQKKASKRKSSKKKAGPRKAAKS